MKRRSLLMGSGGMLLATLLGGCRPKSVELRVDLLENSIPATLLAELQKQIRPANFQVKSLGNLDDLYTALQTYHTPKDGDSPPLPYRADVLSLGDGWLTSAIREQLIQPMTPQHLPGWERLPQPWKALVRRDHDGFAADSGPIWGAPWRWGMLAIAYRKEEFSTAPPQDWDVLWRPELARRISLPDRARAVLGLTLKHLGYSINQPDLDALADLPDTLAALNRQTRFYSSSEYLEPLILGDTWLAVGWSTDIVPLLKKNPRLGAVIPASGTLLTADLWVRPASLPNAPVPTPETQSLVDQWIQYYWQPNVATRLSLLGSAASPVILGASLDGGQPSISLPSGLHDNPLILPAASVLEQSEFLQPLTESSAETYRRQWTAMRQG